MANTVVRLNLINRSQDVDNSDIVIFQKNASQDFEEIAIAWRVIRNLGHDDNHPFAYPLAFQVGASDSWGNFTPRTDASYGQEFEMVRDTSGDVLKLAQQPSQSPHEVEIANNLTQGAISALVYRDGLVAASKTNVAPGQKAVFSFRPVIHVGVVSQAAQGEAMDAAIVSSINTELNLEGIASADLVWTGGGAGPNATPFAFHLENVNAT